MWKITKTVATVGDEYFFEYDTNQRWPFYFCILRESYGQISNITFHAITFLDTILRPEFSTRLCRNCEYFRFIIIRPTLTCGACHKSLYNLKTRFQDNTKNNIRQDQQIDELQSKQALSPDIYYCICLNGFYNFQIKHVGVKRNSNLQTSQG